MLTAVSNQSITMENWYLLHALFISYGKKSKYEKDELYNVVRYADVRRRHFLATIPYSICVGMLAGYVLLINEKVNVARVINLFFA